GDLFLIDLYGVPHRLFHAVEVERPVACDALRHFPNEPFCDVALARRFLSIVRDQQIEDRRIGDVLGEIVGVGELAAWVAVERLEPFEMLRLRSARTVAWRKARPARRRWRGLRDHQR